MKAILISIQPKWCELIACGKKTVEVRKTRPKIATPFKCYIYETNWSNNTYWKNRHKGKLGKVIGEFVCDKIYHIQHCYEADTGYDWWECHYEAEKDCLSEDEFEAYLMKKGYGYGWHISDLVIYDNPRELNEFYQEGENNDHHYYDYCGGCPYHETPIGEYPCNECDGNRNYLYRPPQSWCYVESEEEK